MVSIERFARVICCQGDVCDFLNQLQTTINAKTTALSNFKAGLKNAFNPSLAAA